MAMMNIILPAMGEGVIEATINKWLVTEGATVKEEDPIVEIATDKVDSELPSPSDGVIASIHVKEGDVAKIGDIIAVIETVERSAEPEKVLKEVARIRETIKKVKKDREEASVSAQNLKSRTPSGKFISPLVKSIANREGITEAELDALTGTGIDDRITKDDILNYIGSGRNKSAAALANEAVRAPKTGKVTEQKKAKEASVIPAVPAAERFKAIITEGDEIIEMDRIRRLTSEHMVYSKRTSAHVTSFIDADVTRLVSWRNSVKDTFLSGRGEKLTLTPVFIDAAAIALKDFPMINISVDGTNIIKRKNINIGMATALPNDTLIVPVIRNADEKSLAGLAHIVNDLAERARINKLKPDEITGGTFTVTNFGSYNNLAGTPIINQPQAAILGTGAVRKKPAVIETPEGDVIAIRNIMILSLTYDHRVIDGALAAKFLQKIKEILENYPPAK
jgi:2-oxoglutarate dehydrogenase E2 component (dihydrolipoamide succinyltransferase)